MSRRVKWAVAAATLLVFAVAVTIFFLPREPKYNGRPLSAWLKDLDNPDPKTQARAEAAIRQMGPRAVPFLTRSLQERDSMGLRLYRKDLLPKRLVEALKNRVKWHAPIFESRSAANGLALLGSAAAPAIPELIAALRDPSPWVAGAAAQALAKIGAPAVPALRQALLTFPREQTSWVIRALAAVGPAAEPVARDIAQFLDAPAPDGDFAAVALSQIGPVSAPFVTNFVYHTNLTIRLRAVTYFERLGTNALFATNLLFSLAHDDPEPKIRRAAYLALWNFQAGFETLRPVWTRGLEDPDPATAIMAMNFLSSDIRGVRAASNELARLAVSVNTNLAATASNMLTMFNAWPKKEAASNSPAAAH